MTPRARRRLVAQLRVVGQLEGGRAAAELLFEAMQPDFELSHASHGESFDGDLMHFVHVLRRRAPVSRQTPPRSTP